MSKIVTAGRGPSIDLPHLTFCDVAKQTKKFRFWKKNVGTNLWYHMDPIFPLDIKLPQDEINGGLIGLRLHYFLSRLLYILSCVEFMEDLLRVFWQYSHTNPAHIYYYYADVNQVSTWRCVVYFLTFFLPTCFTFGIVTRVEGPCCQGQETVSKAW